MSFSSAAYWEKRYARGGNSGDGSFGELANYKARVVNTFVADHHITSVIELGCGDGNQAALFDLPAYLGCDISKTAIISATERCALIYATGHEQVGPAAHMRHRDHAAWVRASQPAWREVTRLANPYAVEPGGKHAPGKSRAFFTVYKRTQG